MSDFLILDVLIRSRIGLSITAARRILMTGMVALSSVSLLSGAVLAAALSTLGERTVTFGTAALITGVLLSFLVITAEWTIGPKRLVVSRSAHRGLFRAVDASALHLLVCTVSLRTMPVFAMWQFVVLGWAVGVGGRVPVSLLTVAVAAPCATFAAHVGIIAVSGATGPRPAAAGSLLSVLVVALLIPLVPGVRALDIGDLEAPDLDADGAVLAWVAVVAALVVVFALGVCALRRVARSPFSVRGAPLSASRTVDVKKAMIRQSGRAQWTGVLWGALSFALVALLIALVVRLAGIDVPRLLHTSLPHPADTVSSVGDGWLPVTLLDLVRQISLAVVASVGFVVMETSLGFIGPGRARAHLRFAYESGASRFFLVLSTIAVNSGGTAIFGALAGLAYVTLTDDFSGGMTLIASSVTVAAAALMADAMVPAVRRPDGSSERSIVKALVSTGAAAPLLALAARTNDDVAAVGSCVGSIVLLGGAAWTLSRHLQRRSS